MNTTEIQQKIVQYGANLARFDVDNVESGFLTLNRINPLEKGQVLALSQETEMILRQFVNAYEEHTDNKFEGYDAGILFQYTFDKVVEVTYKVITDADIDTQFIPNEPFEYHEPDLPVYIQQKLTNAVGKIATLCSKVIDYIDKNNFRTDCLNDWLLPLLLVAAYTGIEFAQEIDLDDDNELQEFLGQ